MDVALHDICALVRNNPLAFTHYSADRQQYDPLSRISSLSSIISRLPLSERSLIIDIGTGFGYGAVLLNGLGHTVVGIESNRNKLEEGVAYWAGLGIDCEVVRDLSLSLKRGKLYFAERNSRDLGELPDCSVDAMTVFYMSGYMIKENAFKEVPRLLKPNGSLIITTEGPVKLPAFLRPLAVRLAARAYKPRALRLESVCRIDDPAVYDRFVLLYKKDLEFCG